ncbi:hypothetical protein HQ535_16360 [bacterium]|nr:hypothetical protein [bacterium]
MTIPPGVVTVHRVTLYALDNGDGQACVTLHRTNIATGSDDEMATVCSDGADPEVRPFFEAESARGGSSIGRAPY